jgi:hypothetical protein
MMHNQSVAGLLPLCNALRNNKTLLELIIENNELNNANCVMIAFELQYNSNLLGLKCDGNAFDKKWFTSNTFIQTHLNPRMPSLQTILDRNKEIHERKLRYGKRDSIVINLCG